MKGKGKTLGAFSHCRQLKDKRAKSKPWKTFLKKSFPNLSKNFYLKPRSGFRKNFLKGLILFLLF
jgi:hypothetical protein